MPQPRCSAIGLTADDPELPLALTAGSYVGIWDLRDSTTAVSPSNGTTVFIIANGTVSCLDKETNTSFACTVNITNPATGAFTYTDVGGTTASGNFNFLAGTTSGSYVDPTSTPTTGNFVGGRR